ncbi:hypothetical protein L522_4161 [Bordetella bronchiseptica MBORD707]|nr:hypothetical protein L522_4161 [Bordetella bronchiseptica MBORD707]
MSGAAAVGITVFGITLQDIYAGLGALLVACQFIWWVRTRWKESKAKAAK